MPVPVVGQFLLVPFWGTLPLPPPSEAQPSSPGPGHLGNTLKSPLKAASCAREDTSGGRESRGKRWDASPRHEGCSRMPAAVVAAAGGWVGTSAPNPRAGPCCANAQGSFANRLEGSKGLRSCAASAGICVPPAPGCWGARLGGGRGGARCHPHPVGCRKGTGGVRQRQRAPSG